MSDIIDNERLHFSTNNMYTLKSPFIVLLISTFTCCSTGMTNSLSVWIDRCTLHTKYTAFNWNRTSTCLSINYLISLKDKNSLLGTTDTDAMTYSYNGINSTSAITVKFIPIYRCNGFEAIQGQPREKFLNGTVVFPSNTSQVHEGENLTIKCPIGGAYKTIKSITWSQKIGENMTSIRNFSSNQVHIVQAKFEDTGKFFYSVEYQECGQPSGGFLKRDGFVSVNFNGPPIISSVTILSGRGLALSIQVISSPGAPHRNVTIENRHGITLNANVSRVSSSTFPHALYGSVVNVKGYEMDVILRNVSNDWTSDITVYVSNSIGKRGYTMTSESKTRSHGTHVPNFILENKLLVFGLGGGVLLVIIICGIILCRMKKRTRGVQIDQVIEEPNVDVADHLYSSVYSKKNEKAQENHCGYQISNEQRIERERQQIASLYSFGGFSLSEFQEEDNTYHNDEMGKKYEYINNA